MIPPVRDGDDEEVLSTFGATDRASREALGISQERLAEIAGLHRTYVSSLERGHRNVSVLNVVKLARALDVAPARAPERPLIATGDGLY